MSECIPVVVVEDEELILTATERKQKLCGFHICSTEDDPSRLKTRWEKNAAGHANST